MLSYALILTTGCEGSVNGVWGFRESGPFKSMSTLWLRGFSCFDVVSSQIHRYAIFRSHFRQHAFVRLQGRLTRLFHLQNLETRLKHYFLVAFALLGESF